MKPILFSTPMVQAILGGRKTMTRRAIKPQPELDGDVYNCGMPTYIIGDVLWARETWCRISDWTIVDPDLGIYDGYMFKADWPEGLERPTWRPSIYMPREAARIFLRVTDVRTEKVQEIMEEDAEREGVEYGAGQRRWTARSAFMDLWDALNAKRGYGWDANPWVWVYTFERISAEEAKEATP